MRIHTMTPFKNEAHRYLKSCLTNAWDYADEVFTYDDESTDDSFSIALDSGAMVATRGPLRTSFVEHEGKFRQNMWDDFCALEGPSAGDWILALDADEALVANGNVRDLLEENIFKAKNAGAVSCLIEIPEFFGLNSDGIPMRRIDGEWGKIRGTRLFAWQPNGRYPDKGMASGAEPSYVQAGKFVTATGLWLTHWGYVDAEDRRSKFDRYTKHLGHGIAHVNSILGNPILKDWDGPLPTMSRGME